MLSSRLHERFKKLLRLPSAFTNFCHFCAICLRPECLSCLAITSWRLHWLALKTKGKKNIRESFRPLLRIFLGGGGGRLNVLCHHKIPSKYSSSGHQRTNTRGFEHTGSVQPPWTTHSLWKSRRPWASTALTCQKTRKQIFSQSSFQIPPIAFIFIRSVLHNGFLARCCAALEARGQSSRETKLQSVFIKNSKIKMVI